MSWNGPNALAAVPPQRAALQAQSPPKRAKAEDADSRKNADAVTESAPKPEQKPEAQAPEDGVDEDLLQPLNTAFGFVEGAFRSESV